VAEGLVAVVRNQLPGEPQFPLEATWLEDGEVVVLADQLGLETSLEWIDTRLNSDEIVIRDALGRLVDLEIHALQLVRFSLFDGET
jgi:hypothetical protein